MRLLVALAAVAAVAAAGPCGAPGRAAEEPFVVGELIVGFEPASPIGRASAEAGGGLKGNRALDQGLAELSREVGVPLLARQLTSGGELLLVLDREALVAEWLGRLRRNPNVEGAERLAHGETILPLPREEVRVGLRPGSEAARLATAAHRGGAQPPDLGALESLLSPHPLAPTAVRLAGESEVVLSLDLEALTLSLVRRLERSPDVGSVELNRLADPG